MLGTPSIPGLAPDTDPPARLNRAHPLKNELPVLVLDPELSLPPTPRHVHTPSRKQGCCDKWWNPHVAKGSTFDRR
jgi:hypothetical protein